MINTIVSIIIIIHKSGTRERGMVNGRSDAIPIGISSSHHFDETESQASAPQQSPGSPKHGLGRSKSVRIAFGGKDVSSEGRGSLVTQLSVPDLARKLHIPVESLSKSLSENVRMGSSQPRSDHTQSFGHTPPAHKTSPLGGLIPRSPDKRSRQFSRKEATHIRVIDIPVTGEVEYGVRWEGHSGNVIATRVLIDGLASKYGIREGMQLLEIDSVPVSDKSDLIPLLSTIGKTVSFRVRVPHVPNSSPRHSVDSMFDLVDEEVISNDENDPFLPENDDRHAYILSSQRTPSQLLVGGSYDKGSINHIPPVGEKKRSFFGSMMRTMSGALGLKQISTTSRDHDSEVDSEFKTKPRVGFVDETGADLVSSVRVYDEVDTVVLELRYVFPRWVWIALLLLLVASTMFLPSQLLATHGSTPPHLGIVISAVIELVPIIALFFASIMNLRSNEKAFLKRRSAWGCLIAAGLSMGGSRLFIFHAAFNRFPCESHGKPEHCPPVIVQSLAPIILLCYYATSRWLERIRVGTAENPCFVLEAVGVLLTLCGGIIIATQQAKGFVLEVIVFCFLASLCSAIDILMRRRVASQIPVPVSLMIVHLVSLCVSLVAFLVSESKLQLHDISKDTLYHLIVAAFTGFVASLTLMLCLRHLHPYPVACVSSLGLVTVVVFAKSIFGVVWDPASSVAIPATMISCMGTVLAVWASVHHRSVIEVEIVQEKKLRRRKATGIKSKSRRKKRGARTECEYTDYSQSDCSVSESDSEVNN